MTPPGSVPPDRFNDCISVSKKRVLPVSKSARLLTCTPTLAGAWKGVKLAPPFIEIKPLTREPKLSGWLVPGAGGGWVCVNRSWLALVMMIPLAYNACHCAGLTYEPSGGGRFCVGLGTSGAGVVNCTRTGPLVAGDQRAGAGAVDDPGAGGAQADAESAAAGWLVCEPGAMARVVCQRDHHHQCQPRPVHADPTAAGSGHQPAREFWFAGERFDFDEWRGELYALPSAGQCRRAGQQPGGFGHGQHAFLRYGDAVVESVWRHAAGRGHGARESEQGVVGPDQCAERWDGLPDQQLL